MSDQSSRKFAVVTGGSSGIGLELSKQFLRNGFDVLIAADVDVEQGEQELRAVANGASVTSLAVDLATREGVAELHTRLQGRKVDALAANAGIGLGKGFFEQDRADWLKVIETNIIGTLDLIQLVGQDMREAGGGRILVTSSIASQIPGSFNAVYNASKAFLQSFSFAIRNELKDTGVSVTALLPGPTDTDFFERGDLGETKVGQGKKDDPAAVAKLGYQALMDGEGDAVYGLKNKLQVAAAKVIPDDRLAEQHRGMAAPDSARKAG